MMGPIAMYVEESSDPASFEAGLAHHRAGRLPQAEAIYRQILASEPDHVDSLHLLAVASLEACRPHRALELHHRSLKPPPCHNGPHSHIAATLTALRRQH